MLCKWIFFLQRLPLPSRLRVSLLRLFGAKVGRGVIIRSGVNIVQPWRLTIGDYVWIGEEVFILNLGGVVIESHCCISQRAFLCAASHDFRLSSFALVLKPIRIAAHSWIAAQAFVGPGVVVGPGAMVSAGSVVVRDVPEGARAYGNPAVIKGNSGG